MQNRRTVRGKRPTEAITADDVEALLGVISRQSIAGTRWRAWVLFAFRTGLRVQETLDLTLEDLNLREATGSVRSGKGKKSHRFGIPQDALGLLETWLARRAKLAKERGWSAKKSPVFCSTEGAKLERAGVASYLRRMAVKAGIDRPVRPHGFRAGHAVHMLKDGRSLNEVSKALNHARLSTTDAYLRQMGESEHIDAQRDAVPLPGYGPPPVGEETKPDEPLASTTRETLERILAKFGPLTAERLEALEELVPLLSMALADSKGDEKEGAA